MRFTSNRAGQTFSCLVGSFGFGDSDRSDHDQIAHSVALVGFELVTELTLVGLLSVSNERSPQGPFRCTTIETKNGFPKGFSPASIYANAARSVTAKWHWQMKRNAGVNRLLLHPTARCANKQQIPHTTTTLHTPFRARSGTGRMDNSVSRPSSHRHRPQASCFEVTIRAEIRGRSGSDSTKVPPANVPTDTVIPFLTRFCFVSLRRRRRRRRRSFSLNFDHFIDF